MRDRLLAPGRFREIRKQKRLTLAALADKAGVSLSYVKLVESGRTQPSDPYAAVLADALECNVDDFSEPKAAA